MLIDCYSNYLIIKIKTESYKFKFYFINLLLIKCGKKKARLQNEFKSLQKSKFHQNILKYLEI